MKAVIMAGGEGTRLRPLTLNLPKPLVPMCGKPMMEYIISSLNKLKIEETLVTLQYLGWQIESYFGTGEKFNVKISYSYEEKPLGTAGCVKLLEDKLNDTFLIVSGDSLTDIDLKTAIKEHNKKKPIVSIILTRVKKPLEYGVVITDNEGYVSRFLEKPGWEEVFSDTVNTGIYIMEPEIFKYIPKDTFFDFSKDLFPKLLEKGKKIAGIIANGYWCDVGNLQQYRQAHIDILEKNVKVDLSGSLSEKGFICGKSSEISPNALIKPPVYIGSNCKIKGNCIIEDFSVIGDNVIIEEENTISRSIIWSNTYIGRKSNLSGCTICRGVTLEGKNSINEGAIIADNCKIGHDSIINSNVKIWPEKIIEPGANVNMNIIWGHNWPDTLFSALGVKGLANIDITPEYAARLGASYGASLEKGSLVSTSRSPHKVARIIKRALTSGLMSVGVNIIDLRDVPLPLSRYVARTSPASGGIHVRLSPYEPDKILIEIFDKNGVNIDSNRERKIETIFYRQDFRRTDLFDVGNIEYQARVTDSYVEDFLKFIDIQTIKEKKLKLVIDYSKGSLTKLLPYVLSKLNCEAISLNAYLNPEDSPSPTALDKSALMRLSEIVTSTNSDVGFLVDGEAEKLSLITNEGEIFSAEKLLVLMVKLICMEYKKPKIALQVTAPVIIEEIVKSFGGEIIMTKANSRALMTEAAKNPSLSLAGDSKGGFIFPSFQPAFDALVTMGKILEFISKYNSVTLKNILKEIPELFIDKCSIPCHWENKGKVLRLLNQKHSKDNPILIDGIKIFENEKEWVTIRPDPSNPSIIIYAEGKNKERVKKIIEKYLNEVKNIINK